MNNGWIKLHRKLLDNPTLKWDSNAFIVFTKLLLIMDYKTGSYNMGRFQIAELTGLKPTTAYKTLKRLEKAKMVTLVSNNKYTTISICKWKEYQDDSNNAGNNQVTSKGQPSNTKQEVKKLRSKKVTTKVVTPAVDKRDPNIKLVIEHFEKNINKMPRPSYQPMAASELIESHGFQKTIGAINAVVATRGQPYAPNIASLEELRDKWTKLENFLGRSQPINKPRRKA